MKIELGKMVYHKDIYGGKEKMKIVGITETQVELEGDYSGGTHCVSQRSWLPIEGLLSEQPVILCKFSKKELDLIAKSLTHLLTSSVLYLDSKKDEFSQREIPKKIERILELYNKVHVLQS